MLKYGIEGTKYYKVKAMCILYLFNWWGMCVQLQAPRKQITVITGNIMVWQGRGTSLPESHISLLHLKLQLLWPWLQQHGTSTTVKQCSHPDLNVCINPPIRSPNQNPCTVFKCLPLSRFHSKIPKIYTFQTWYILSLCHSFLCLGSPCHTNSNAMPAGFITVYSTLHKLIQGFWISWLRWHTNISVTVSSHSCTTTEIISSMHILTDQYPRYQLVTSSHSGVTPHSSLVIFVFSKQCSSFRLLSCSIKCSAYSTHTSLANKIPWSSKGHTTHYVYSPWYGT